ncbi:MAG: hypothetical protein ACRBCS_09580 [Cellvibrionaceae bacterium]
MSGAVLKNRVNIIKQKKWLALNTFCCFLVMSAGSYSADTRESIEEHLDDLNAENVELRRRVERLEKILSEQLMVNREEKGEKLNSKAELEANQKHVVSEHVDTGNAEVSAEVFLRVFVFKVSMVLLCWIPLHESIENKNLF